jgi:hypothetical protein
MRSYRVFWFSDAASDTCISGYDEHHYTLLFDSRYEYSMSAAESLIARTRQSSTFTKSADKTINTDRHCSACLHVSLFKSHGVLLVLQHDRTQHVI